MTLTVPEAARRTGRNPETIRRWIREGKLASRKVGTQHLIEEGDLVAITAPPAHALARLVASICAIVAPRRLSLEQSSGVGALGVVLDIEREPDRTQVARIQQVAARLGASVRIRSGRPAGETPAAGEEVIFDRADLPQSILERLVAEGRARAPLDRSPFPLPDPASSGRSASEEIIREREESPW